MRCIIEWCLYETDKDTTLFAEALISYYLKRKTLNMTQLKRIAQNTGFVINVKSVRPIINIIRKFYE